MNDSAWLVFIEQMKRFCSLNRENMPADDRWNDEPDWDLFDSYGFVCLMMRRYDGAWRGYVCIPSGHPWREASHLDISVSCGGRGVDDSFEECGLKFVGFNFSDVTDYIPVDLMKMNNEKREYRDAEYVRRMLVTLSKQASFCPDRRLKWRMKDKSVKGVDFCET